MTSILVALSILAVSHLTVDKDFPVEIRNAAEAFFIIVGIAYLIFGLIV